MPLLRNMDPAGLVPAEHRSTMFPKPTLDGEVDTAMNKMNEIYGWYEILTVTE